MYYGEQRERWQWRSVRLTILSSHENRIVLLSSFVFFFRAFSSSFFCVRVRVRVRVCLCLAGPSGCDFGQRRWIHEVKLCETTRRIFGVRVPLKCLVTLWPSLGDVWNRVLPCTIGDHTYSCAMLASSS